MIEYIARGGGGGHSSGGHSSGRSFSSRSSSKVSSKSSSKSTTKKTTTKKTTTAKATTKKVAPKTTKQKLAESGAKGKAQTVTPKSINGKKVGEGHTVTHQHFHNYRAPAGSVVYYPQHSAMDYLPWIFLFSQNNSPHNGQATVVQPDGKQVQTKQDTGTDGTMILEWIIMLAIVGAVLFGLYKLTKKVLRG